MILNHSNAIIYSLNMGTSDLPEMSCDAACSCEDRLSAIKLGLYSIQKMILLRAQPKDCGNTFQANHKCPCYTIM